jgi:hypothetical protein
MTDSFWERRTTFWHDKEPSPGAAQATDEASFWKDKEPLKVTAAGAEARSEAGSRVIRRLRRMRTGASRRRLLALGALASAAVIVFAYAFLTSDVARTPDGGRAARPLTADRRRNARAARRWGRCSTLFPSRR